MFTPLPSVKRAVKCFELTRVLAVESFVAQRTLAVVIHETASRTAAEMRPSRCQPSMCHAHALRVVYFNTGAPRKIPPTAHSSCYAAKSFEIAN